MVRKNYGHESGVIIDWCGDHGIWFDDDELSRIIDWIRTGGLTTADKETAARIVRKREQKQSDESYQASRSVFGQSINYDDDELSPSIISTVFRTLADLF